MKPCRKCSIVTKIEIIERQESIIRELTALNAELVRTVLLLGGDADGELIARSRSAQTEAEEYC